MHEDLWFTEIWQKIFFNRNKTLTDQDTGI